MINYNPEIIVRFCISRITKRGTIGLLYVLIIMSFTGCAGLPFRDEWIIPDNQVSYPILEGIYITCNRQKHEDFVCNDEKGSYTYVTLANNYYEVTSDSDELSDAISSLRFYPIVASIKDDTNKKIGDPYGDAYIAQMRYIRAPTRVVFHSETHAESGDIYFVRIQKREIDVYVPLCGNTGDAEKATPATRKTWTKLFDRVGQLVRIEDKTFDTIDPRTKKTKKVQTFDCFAIDLDKTNILGEELFFLNDIDPILIKEVAVYKLKSASEPHPPARTFE